jgi:hypothetical protein
MAYVLLIFGIALTIYGLIGMKISDKPKIQSKDGTEFDQLITSRMLLEKLDAIEEKLELIAGAENEENYNDMEYEEDSTADGEILEDMDINRQIALMNEKGMSVETIAQKMGMLKGEVLLRLGLKK